MTQPTLFNLHPNKYILELLYYPFAVNLDPCMGSYNTQMIYPIKYVFQTKQKI